MAIASKPEKTITLGQLLNHQSSDLHREASELRKALVVITSPESVARIEAKADALDTWAYKITASLKDYTREQLAQKIYVDVNW